MKAMPYVLRKSEKNLVINRNKLVHSGYIHPDFTGGGFKRGFEEYESGGMRGMTCDGHINLFSPVGRYLLDGTLDRDVVGFEDEKLEFTYLDMVMDLMMAINKLRLKEITVEEGEETYKDVVQAMTMLQIALPVFFATHVTHQVLHIAEELPAYVYAVHALEQLMRNLRSKMHNLNPAQRDQTINNNARWEHGVFVAAVALEASGEAGGGGVYQRMISAKLQPPVATEYSRTGKEDGIAIFLAF